MKVRGDLVSCLLKAVIINTAGFIANQNIAEKEHVQGNRKVSSATRFASTRLHLTSGNEGARIRNYVDNLLFTCK
jgi:hypothetical protein